MATTTTSPRPVTHERPATRLAGPPWRTAVGNTVRFLRDALGVSVAMRERYGDVVSVPTLVGMMTMIFHPDGVRRVLQENHTNYNKDIPDYHILSLLIGKGLVTNDGASWLQQRRLIQPFPSVRTSFPRVLDGWSHPHGISPCLLRDSAPDRARACRRA